MLHLLMSHAGLPLTTCAFSRRLGARVWRRVGVPAHLCPPTAEEAGDDAARQSTSLPIPGWLPLPGGDRLGGGGAAVITTGIGRATSALENLYEPNERDIDSCNERTSMTRNLFPPLCPPASISARGSAHSSSGSGRLGRVDGVTLDSASKRPLAHARITA